MLPLAEVRSRFGFVICCIAGVSLPFAFAPFNVWLVAPLALAALFVMLSGTSPRQAFIRALVFGFSSFLVGAYWIFISVSVFYGAPAALGIAATVGLALLLASFVAVVVSLVARFVSLSGVVGAHVVLPAAWVLAEWLRSWLFTGFGWLSAGYSQTDTWLMSFAPMLGLLGVSYAVALTAGALASTLSVPASTRRTAAMLVVAVWGIAWIFSGWRWTSPRPSLVNVAIAQAAIDQDRKWLPEQYQPTLDIYRELSLRAGGRDLIVWPEVAVPNLYEYARDYLQIVQQEVAQDGATLVTGILQRQDDGAQLNSVVAMTASPQFFAKRHLVPFGEYIPLPRFMLTWLGNLGIPYPDIGAGESDQALLAVAGEQLSVSICYEDVFGAEQRDFLPAASLIVNVANDAWFGRSIAAEQHLQIARLRAAEAGRYVLRATNTGVSAVIDPLGNVVERGPSYEPALLQATVQGFEGSTPYVRFGDAPVVLISLVLLSAAVFREKRRG